MFALLLLNKSDMMPLLIYYRNFSKKVSMGLEVNRLLRNANCFNYKFTRQYFYLCVKQFTECVGLHVARRKFNFSNSRLKYSVSLSVGSRPLRALFFGTDDFSLESLKVLCNELRKGGLSGLDIVTSNRSKINLVRDFAMEQNLKVHSWPPEVSDGEYDVGLVVSFGHLLPKKIINAFPLGILNVHASLLPRWRGAAPIIYAIMNGDTETGVTMMRVEPHRFDVGDIVRQACCPILPHETRQELSSRLAKMGSQLLLETIRDLPHCLETAKPQPTEGVTYAPRVTSHLSQVQWCEMDSSKVLNLSRALEDLYPLATTWHGLPVKLLHATSCTGQSEVPVKQSRTVVKPGCVEFHRPSRKLRVLCRDECWVYFTSIGLPGKKPMLPVDFYNGYLSKRNQVEWIFT